MQQIIIDIEQDDKAKYFIDFLKQIDFITINKIISKQKLSSIEKEIIESCEDLKNDNTTNWKDKEIVLKDA